jgi:transposase
MERLKMHQIRDIIYRLRSSQSDRRIARDLGCSRNTVRHYHERCERLGYLDAGSPLPSDQQLLESLGPAPKPPQAPSTVEPYRALVVDWVNQHIEMSAILMRLQQSHGYTGSYSSVRRFVRQVCPGEKRVVVRIETGPGQVAQVDFGGVGTLRDSRTGTVRKAYCFVMTLCFSRHMYVQFVFDQTIATWVSCHVNAFDFFGGVPKEIVVDNLKAAILRAALEDAVLCVPYSRLAQHNGFLIHPCRPATPQHKGKVENQVRYVQRSLMNGYDFLDERDANNRARDWVMGHAGERIHGTTQQQPLRLFLQEEKAVLMPLPVEPFDLRTVRPAMLHPDCHIVLEKSYYSAPHIYVGQKVEAHVYTDTVQIYVGAELVRTHQRATRPGQRMTNPDDYPPGKSIYLMRTPNYCRRKAIVVGESCVELVDQLFSRAQPLDHLRAVQALIGLIDKYGERRLEAACARALAFGDPSYRRVKKILAAGAEDLAIPFCSELHHIEPRQQYAFARAAEEFFSGLFEEETISKC